MSRLRDAVGDAPFIFVVGKGGVGKTTAAGALALEFADDAGPAHLISTDPAHSIGDLFGQRLSGPTAADCAVALTLEEFDAAAYAAAWVGNSVDRVAQIVERGTYLDEADVSAFARLALPGVDELMAVLRLTDLAGTADMAAGAGRTIVDTAPTGHTLRMLDAAATLDGVARVLRAMADKAGAVAGGMMGRPMRLAGESVIDELRSYVTGFRRDVLDRAAFIVVDRPGAVVAAETQRLLAALDARGLRTVARVTATGVSAPAARDDTAEPPEPAPSADSPVPGGAAAVHLMVPALGAVTGCDGLRRWRSALQPFVEPSAGPAPKHAQPTVGVPHERTSSSDSPTPALPWLVRTAPRMLVFAGKGGVGKSSCAAAAALALADTRDVLLCSADPAGSLDDVLTGPDGAIRLPARLRTVQIEPAGELARFRETWNTDVDAALESIGLSASAALDRRVVEELSSLAPPGLDELAAIASMSAAAGAADTIVLDTAPTGHLLRLLGTPALALDWTRQAMRVIVKYGLSGTASGLATSLVKLSRQLRALQDSLHNGAETAVIVVTLDEPMVAAETERLIDGLRAASVRIAGVLHNRVSPARAAPAAAARDPGAQPGSAASPVVMTAPRVAALTGSHALREFIGAWNIVG